MISKDVKKGQDIIKRIINDPLVKILLENSLFTKIQLETLLIDLLAEQLLEKKISYGEKSKIRLTNRKISRGSFNRTLQQARKNMMKSIWTVLMLGYLKVLDTPSLSPFLEVSNRLEGYLRDYESIREEFKNNSDRQISVEDLLFLKNNVKNIIFELVSSRKGGL